MWDELKRHIQLWIDQITARINTYFRKMQIRHAYHPVRIATPVLLFLLLAVGTITIITLSSSRIYKGNSQKGLEEKTDTASVDTSAVTKAIIPQSKDEQINDYFLAPFPAIFGHEEMNFLLVADKYDRVLHLLKNQRSTWGVIKSYPIAIGSVTGRKETQGDKKTPEGTYIIINRKNDEELNEIYGPLAYVLNYPNREDSIAGRTGSGIWIHGTVDKKVPVDTKGCLEMHNNNIEKLSSYLKSGDLIPVVIHNNPAFNLERDINLERCWSEREKVILSRTETSDTSSPPELPDTPDTTLTFSVAQTEITADTLTPEEQELKSETDTAQIILTENREEDTLENSRSDSTQTEISEPGSTQTEISEPNSTLAEISEPDSTQSEISESEELSEEQLIRKRIMKWRNDWESADISRYQSNYDTLKFHSGDYNWERWRTKKIRTFRNYSTISIKIKNMKITEKTDSKATVVFHQKYQSDLFRAENGKKIVLQNRAGNWKIVQELTVRYKESQ